MPGPASPPPVPGNPVLRWFSRIGRALRFLAGVDEALLNRVPQERAWYASLGGIVLGTATIAAFSMWFATSEAANINPVAALLPAAIWFLFILIFDRWIVSARTTTPGNGSSCC